MATTESMNLAQELYVGYYGRPADPAGLSFWADYFDGTDDLDQALSAFGTSDEYTESFGSLTNEELVNNLYQQMFSRDAGDEGLEFYTGRLESGEATLASIAKQIADGATGDDLTTLSNKTTVANTYTDAVTSMGATYESDDIADAQAILDAVDETDASVDTGNDAAEAEVGSNVEGGTVTLTVDPDTETANIFNAGRDWNPDGSDYMNTLNDDDVLTGVGDNPTLNMTFVNDTEANDLNLMPSMTNIQTVNVAFTADANQTLDLQDTTGVLEVNATRIDNIVAGVVTFDNIQSVLESASVSNSNDNTTTDVAFDHSASVLSGDEDEVDLSLANVQLDDLRIDGVTEGYETLNLDSSTQTNSLNTLTTEDTVTLNITGDADLTLGATNDVVDPINDSLDEADLFVAGLINVAGSLTLVDASEFTGDLTYHIGFEINANADADGTDVELSVLGGSGDDTFVLTNGNNVDADADNTDTIDGGDGTNTLIITGGAAQTIAAPDAGANLTNIQALEIRTGHDNNSVAENVTVDADAFDSLATILVRNEGQDLIGGFQEADTENSTVTLNDLTADQALAITIEHSTSENTGLAQNILISDLATDTANDTLGLTIQTAINTDQRFNFQIQENASTSYESLTINDTDAKSGTIQLDDFDNYTETITIEGGVADTFLNLDSDTAVTAVGGLAGGMYGYDTTAVATNVANGDINVGDYFYVLDAAATATVARLTAEVIDAEEYAGDLVVRVSNGTATTGAQTITMGTGDDTVIFDALNDTHAGLTISDKVAGGDGDDTLVIDGDGVQVSLGSSEWTNVSGFETIRLIGNGQADDNGVNATNAYNLVLTDSMISANAADGNSIAIVNDNGNRGDETAGNDGLLMDANAGVTIDATKLSETKSFSYDGQEDSTDGKAVNLLGVAQDQGAVNSTSTADRFILTDSTLNGLATIDGGADLDQSGLGALTALGVGGSDMTHASNLDVLEIQNTAVVSIGDLSGLANVSNIEFTNTEAVDQVLTLELDDTVVDTLVNNTAAANGTNATTIAQTFETLTITAIDSTTVAAADAILDIDASAITNGALRLYITGSDDADTFVGGGSVETYVYTGDDSGIGTTVTPTAALADTITNFTSGTDVIDIVAGNGVDIDGATDGVIVDGSLIAGYAAFVAAATAVFTAGNNASDDIYIAYNLDVDGDGTGDGDTYIAIDDNDDAAFGTTDTQIILAGIDLVTEIALTDFV
ncbi:beta strand repeat-containing protein [Desulfobacter curvatus]|uniref:beta strand repeat-containing protein n=1 Tax=Desulfobacter curvatus TaxID=2290 RepID=UPI00039F1FA9|nr:DUF4214 domain-containing protein [Desulfobacter curvatus]